MTHDFAQQQWQAFLHTQLPTRKDERFKYVDLSLLPQNEFVLAKRAPTEEIDDVIERYRLRCGESILLVNVNGYFMPALSDVAKLPDGIIACNMLEAKQTHASLAANIVADKNPFAQLNASINMDGLFLFVPDACELTIPIHFLSIVVGEEKMMLHPNHLITIGKNSKLTFINEHFSLATQTYLTNAVTTIVLNEAAQLNHYTLQQAGQEAIYFAHTYVQQQASSQANFLNIAVGGRIAREEIVIELQAPEASCDLKGFYHAYRDNQSIHHQLYVTHMAPHTQSNMLYKGILENKSRAVFSGKVTVVEAAKKITAQQANNHLLLSKEAEAYSQPQLEIYADDVKCKHGATTGQLDQDALFYLRARGIDESTAMNMLLQGFAEEITQTISHPDIKLRVQEMLC